MKFAPRLGRWLAVLSVLGLMGMCYLFGAATMYYGLPLSEFFAKGFHGAEQWWASLTAGPRPLIDEGNPSVSVDKPDATYDGYTLVTTNARPGANLLDMNGTVVHRWEMAQKRPWQRAVHVEDPRDDEAIHWERCHVYPNGDILALVGKGNDSPYGYGLGKFDKDSNLIWGYSENVHHDFDVGPDGRVYVLGNRLGVDRPTDADWLPPQYMEEYLIVLSPEGVEETRIPLLDAVRYSPYGILLQSGGVAPMGPPTGPPAPPPGGQPPSPMGGPPAPAQGPPPPRTGFSAPDDVLHGNSVRVLRADQADQFPLFKAGQVLISFRSLSAVAVLDPATRRLTWAARGVWLNQHSAEFLDNGNLLIFDNFGGSNGSRVVEYNPSNQAVGWSYPSRTSKDFLTPFRGTNQRLPNGNTLVVDSSACRIFEVTPELDVVWQWGTGTGSGAATTTKPTGTDATLSYTGAKRYGPNHCTFLKGGPHERPRPAARRDPARGGDSVRPARP